jgi:hypothetical protein
MMTTKKNKNVKRGGGVVKGGSVEPPFFFEVLESSLKCTSHQNIGTCFNNCGLSTFEPYNRYKFNAYENSNIFKNSVEIF